MFHNKKCIIILSMLVAYCGANTVTHPSDDVQVEDLDSEQPCPIVCPSLYGPICGFDGEKFQRFTNPCLMKVKNCERQKEYSLGNLFKATHIDWCNTELVDNLFSFFNKNNVDLNKSECLKPCPMIYEPVCISNGKYRGNLANRCQLDIVRLMALNWDRRSSRF